MANPPKKKGTGFETETVNKWLADGFDAQRMPQGSPYDNTVEPWWSRAWPPLSKPVAVIEALTMRADRGEAFTIITHDDFRRLLKEAGIEVHEECKRFARISVWSIFRKKFPR